MMSQQEMNYGEINHDRSGSSSGSSYGRYESAPHYQMPGEKLSGQAAREAPTAGQRLALAITSLAMLMAMTLGLIALAASLQAPPWVIIPILFILVLFSTVAVIINIVFNRKP